MFFKFYFPLLNIKLFYKRLVFFLFIANFFMRLVEKRTKFSDLLLYHGEFEVKKADYVTALHFNLDELSAALTLDNLGSQLQVAPQVFLQSAAP